MVSHGISWCEYNFFVSLLLHVKVLQFKLHLFYEIPFLEIKKLNIAKDQEKLPKYNLESHIKYEVTHKSCNGRFKIFGEYFAVCFWCSTRQTCNLCRVFFVCRVFFWRAQGIAEDLPCVFCLPCVSRPGTRQTYALPCAQLFAVCCTFDTRQRRCFPCARNMAHGKGFGTRQLGRFLAHATSDLLSKFNP